VAEQQPCRSCGLQNEEGRDFCANCGEYLSWAPTAFVAAVPVTGAAAEAITESTSVESSEEVQTTLIGTRPDDAAPPTDDLTPDSAVTPPQQPLPEDEPAVAPDDPAPRNAPPPSPDAVVGIPEGPPPTGDASIVLKPADPALGAAGVPAVDAGQTLSFVANIRNESSIVDNYDLAVLGLPENWAAVAPAAAFLVPLGEGRGQSSQDVQINISPPREYRSTAGIWTFELIALSRTTATIAARAIAQFEVKPFQQWSVEVVPVVNSGRLKARYRPAVRNDGNAEQELWLIAEPDSPRVRARFQAGRLVLQAGEVGIDVMTVRPRFPRPVGRIGEHRVGVDVLPEQPQIDDDQLSVKEKLAAKAREEAKKTGDAAKGDLQRMKLPRLPRLPNPRQKLQKLKGSMNATALARLRSAGDANAPQTARQVVFRQKPIIPLWLIALIVLAAIAGYIIYTLLPDRTTVPALTGDSFAVEKQLRAKGLKLSQPVQKRTDPNESAGNVIEQTPAAGAKVDKGSAVSIVVADGATKVQVPRLKDLTRVKADERLRDDGLELGDTQPADAPDKFIVRSQIPAAGLSVERGSTVRVFLKKPPLTKAERAAKKKKDAAAAKAAAAAAAAKASIVIPPIDDKTATEYAAALTKLKLKPDVQNVISSEPAGTVLSVKPQPGEKAKKGAKVTVRASGGSPTLAVETDGLVQLYDPATSKQTGQIPDGDGSASQLSFVPGEDRAAYVSDKGLVVGGLGQGAKQRTIYAGPDALERPSVAPNAKTIAVIRREEGDGDLCFGRIDRKSIDHLCLPDDGWDLTGRIAWRDDGKAVLVPGRLQADPTVFGVRIYQTKTAYTTNPELWSGRVGSDISTPGKGVIAAQYSPDGKQIAAVSNLESAEFEVVLSDASDLELAVDPKATGAAACDVAWRPDGKELAVMQAVEACAEPLGKISRFAVGKPKETTLVADEGRNPVYRPTP
jgi:beta-lactam-binding protein with PASTA domain